MLSSFSLSHLHVDSTCIHASVPHSDPPYLCLSVSLPWVLDKGCSFVVQLFIRAVISGVNPANLWSPGPRRMSEVSDEVLLTSCATCVEAMYLDVILC